MCKSKVVRLLNILEPAAAESEQASAVVTLTGINMHCGTSASWYATQESCVFGWTTFSCIHVSLNTTKRWS